MWASTHGHDDTAAQLLRGSSAATANGHAAEDGGGNRKPAATESVGRQTSTQEHGTAAAGASPDNSERPGTAAGSSACSEAATGEGRLGGVSTVNDGTVGGGSDSAAAPEAGGLRPPTAAHTNGQRSVSGLRTEPLVLPAPECLRPELNSLDRDAQVTLRWPPAASCCQSLDS
jgi:hypothetical protein